jgi:UDP-N-acetylglucosamine--N-acetylmuramyl-(pentapeptide) pyrophosphoryl-undecaprenol N-acetylglucosamine transferase
MKKIIITGGHLTPALAVIEQLKKKENWEIYYLGRKYTFEGSKIPSEESKIIPQYGVKFVPILAGRLQRKFSRYTIPSLLRVPLAFFQSLYLVLKIKPNIILSFGSYVSVPVVFAGWILGIPIVSHEQTVFRGLANRINSFFSKKIAVSHKESLKFFPKNKVVLTGNILRSQIFSPPQTEFSQYVQKAKAEFKLPLIYVTGGNQGAMVINKTILESLSFLLEKYLIIHQTGSLDYNYVLQQAKLLPPKLKNRYFLKDFFPTEEVSWILNNANLVVGRSGANITYELGVLGKPAILIPLPYAGGQEQLKNAKLLEKYGLAEIILQKDFSSQRLISTIEKMFEKYKNYLKSGQKAKKFFLKDGAENLVKAVLDSLQTI